MPTPLAAVSSATSCAGSTEVARPLRILVVCTANICRSPVAEHYLHHHASVLGLELEAASAGFLSAGEPASEAMAKVMRERGVDLSAHRSRIVDAAMVEAVDLVVAMERRHGRELVTRHDAGRIFTLRGAIAALRKLDAGASMPLERIAAIDVERRSDDLLGTGADEIADPFGKSIRVNRRTAEDLCASTEELLRLLLAT